MGRAAGAFASCPTTPNPMSYYLTDPNLVLVANALGIEVRELFDTGIVDE
jgi:hypothetical protein